MQFKSQSGTRWIQGFTPRVEASSDKFLTVRVEMLPHEGFELRLRITEMSLEYTTSFCSLDGYSHARKAAMGTINNLFSYLQTGLPGSGLPTGPTTGSAASAGTSSVTSQSDNQQLSPFAKMMSELQQLQQSNPTKYQQVTAQIATNLQNAAQTAQNNGNTAEAAQLNQLAADFTTASQTGQLPNVQDLAQATSGHHHHHHHSHSSSSDTDSSSSATSTDAWSSNTNSTQSQLLSSYQAGGTQSTSLDPAAIILNTLSSAGITSSGS